MYSGRSAFLIGSNYVWGSTRASAAEGNVVAEKYYRFGDAISKPSLIKYWSTRPLFRVGESSYFFLRQLNDACARSNIQMPVLLINACRRLSHVRLLSCGPWFDTPGNGFQPANACGMVHSGGKRRAHICTGLPSNGVTIQQKSCRGYMATKYPPVGKLQVKASNNHLALPCCIAPGGAIQHHPLRA